MSLLDWVSLFGIGGGVIFGALAYVMGLSNVLSILANAVTIVTPAARGFTAGVTDLISESWDGFKISSANPHVWALIIVLCSASAGATWYHDHKKIVSLETQVETQTKLTNKWYKAYKYAAHR